MHCFQDYFSDTVQIITLNVAKNAGILTPGVLDSEVAVSKQGSTPWARDLVGTDPPDPTLESASPSSPQGPWG